MIEELAALRAELSATRDELAELRESARSQQEAQANANAYERYAEPAILTVLADAVIALAAEGVTGSGTRFIALEGQVDDHEDRITQNEADIDANTTAISDTNARVDGHETRITANEGAIQSNTATLVTQGRRITANEAAIASNTSAIGILQGDVAAMQVSVEQLAPQSSRNAGQIAQNTDGIAIANALSGSTWLQSNEDVAFTANWGHYDGANAIALSAARRISNRFSANLAVGYADQTGKVGARAGVRMGW